MSLWRGCLKSKPVSPGRVNNMLAQQSAQVELTLEEFQRELREGSAFCSGLKSDEDGFGRRKTNFDACSLLFLDIDSGVNWQTEDEVAFEVIQKGVKPTYIYRTFSYTKTQPKWRVLFALTTAVADAELVSKMQLGLHELFPFTDRLFDCTRVLYPGLGCDYFDSKAISEPGEMPLAKLQTGHAFASKAMVHAQQGEWQCLADLAYQQKLAIANMLLTSYSQLANPAKDEHGQHRYKRWQCIRFRTAELVLLRLFSDQQVIDFMHHAISQNPSAWSDYLPYVQDNINAGLAIACSQGGAQVLPDVQGRLEQKTEWAKAMRQTELFNEFTKVYKPLVWK